MVEPISLCSGNVLDLYSAGNYLKSKQCYWLLILVVFLSLSDQERDCTISLQILTYFSLTIVFPFHLKLYNLTVEIPY
jgi:hypothetical protein